MTYIFESGEEKKEKERKSSTGEKKMVNPYINLLEIESSVGRLYKHDMVVESARAMVVVVVMVVVLHV